MTPQEAKRLGRLLRAKREASGLTAREVARRADIDVGTVTRIEQGQILSPRPDSLFAIADWLPKDQLPTFTPYLRAKYKDFPDEAVAQMETFFARLAKKHGVQGPTGGEDER
jgi:transcriptional regulator with XRE-family HTH domain